MAGRVELAARVRAELAGRPVAGRTVLAAVSGGADSVALAAALAELSGELGLRLAVGHLDHAIRECSARESEWVAALAGRLGAAFFAERVDVPALRAREGLTLEEAARRARYGFLERSAAAAGAALVATGHTADDQAETVLFRIVRGTGLAGLAGIPRRRPLSPTAPAVTLIRPLLDCTRAEVLEYLAARGLDHLTDLTNFDTEGQARARIRHELLPRLEAEHNPGVRGALLRLADSAAEAHQALAALAAGRLAEMPPRADADAGRGLRFPVELLDCPMALRLEVLAAAAVGLAGPEAVDRARLAEAARALPGAQVGKSFPAGGVEAVRGYRDFLLRPLPPEPDGGPPAGAWERPLALPGVTRLPCGELRAESLSPAGFDLEAFRAAKTPGQEVLDARALAGPGRPVCRTRRAGDRFRPLGAPGGRRLKEFLIDEKVPRAGRDALPLVARGDEVLWVVGMRLSEEARVRSDSAALVRLEYRADPAGAPNATGTEDRGERHAHA